MSKTGIIYGVNGPVIYLKGNTGFQMSEMVYVGDEKLVGEVIGLNKERTTVQVFERLVVCIPVRRLRRLAMPISVTLGPGILHNIFDGIERPLDGIAKASGIYITRGMSMTSLDEEKKWPVHMTVKVGDEVRGGTIIAETQETKSILHKSMVPPDLSGKVVKVVPDGDYTITEPLVTIQKTDGTEATVALSQKWPIRIPRPTQSRFPASKPLLTGQRILDTLFPIAKAARRPFPRIRYR